MYSEKNIKRRLKDAFGLALIVIPVLGLIVAWQQYGEQIKAWFHALWQPE